MVEFIRGYNRYWSELVSQPMLPTQPVHGAFVESDSELVFHQGPFIFYEGGGAGGIWETPFKNRMTPPQLTNFFTWPPLRAVIFLDDPPPPLKILPF